ncbi:LysR family regulator CbbR [Rhodobacter ferrooxidans]|uniref:HTH-type transcriptional regulator CbbR n=1 Tax=Rhodobacter ferrooxidans TaxID=371731 RepID=C8RX21_9RHOB|nr:LysR family transcriptional regulator [Rhodobacter sp. SW2]EEW26546.1 transcriptional regulator, LysR family [Rhodobacter sp. SW2]
MIRLDAVTLKQLRSLRAIAEHGSMTAAANELGLTPPAIHSQIKNLEAAFAKPLLFRSADSAGSGLTPHGLVVLEAARRIDVTMSQCADQMLSLSQGHSGRVTLGVVSTAKYFAPKLVRLLNETSPDVKITLRVKNREGIIDDLTRHNVDLAIMGRPPRVPEVIATPLGPHPHGLVARPGHPLAGKPSVTAAEILSQTFLAREPGSGTRILMTRYLERLGEGDQLDLIEMNSNETIKQAVIAGMGITFLSLHTVMEELRFGTLVQLAGPGLPIERHWFLVHPTAAELGPAAERLHEEIVALNGSYLPR